MDNPEDLVSVVIPVYNSEKFLKESIESALNQTYPNIEIIAVNDGSTDGSPDILEKYKDRITIINQKNLGLAKAVNAAIDAMSGRWLKWFSPDDILYPNAVETLVEEARKLPENTILYSDWGMIDENGKKLRDFHESNYNDLDNFEFNVRLLDGQQINVNTCIVPASILEGCRPRQLEDTTAVDYDFFLRAGILHGANFKIVEKSLVKYRIHSGQTSHKKIARSLRYLKQVREEVMSGLDVSTQKRYGDLLQKYSEQKGLVRKTMETGLSVLSRLPDSVSDKALVFYLNKIRSRR